MKTIFFSGLICGGLLFLAQFLILTPMRSFLLDYPLAFPSVIFSICGFFGLKKYFKPKDFDHFLFYRNGILASLAIFFVGIVFFSFARTTLNYFYGQGYDDWIQSFIFQVKKNFTLALMFSFLVPIIFFFYKPKNESNNREDILDDISGK